MNVLNIAKRVCLSLCVSLVLSVSAHAGLVGDSVGIRYLGDGDTGVNNVVVGAGEEGNFFGNQFYDFSDFGFSIRSTSTFCGIFACAGESVALLLTSLDLGSSITGVSFSTNLSGVNMSFTGDTVSFNWSEQSITTGTYLTARFVAEGGNNVPEPASLVLIALGLAGLGVARYRKSA